MWNRQASCSTARASLSAGLTVDAQRASESAARLSRGEFLPGAHGAWVERRQAAARELHLCSLELLSELATVAGDHAADVGSAESGDYPGAAGGTRYGQGAPMAAAGATS